MILKKISAIIYIILYNIYNIVYFFAQNVIGQEYVIDRRRWRKIRRSDVLSSFKLRTIKICFVTVITCQLKKYMHVIIIIMSHFQDLGKNNRFIL